MVDDMIALKNQPRKALSLPTIKRSATPGASGRIHHHIEPCAIASGL
jgi:hypothetical protein